MLITLLIFLLSSNAVTNRRDKTILLSRVVILGIIFTSFIAFNSLYVKALENGIGVYNALFNVTTFTQSFNVFILLISSLILVLTAFFPRRIFLEKNSNLYLLLSSYLSYNKTVISNKTGQQFRIIEYALTTVFILCGAVFLISSADLISIFLSIELQSYGLYILCTLYRDSESATSSGLKYFLLGGLSSCFILLGSALLYANSGTTNLDNLYLMTSITEIQEISFSFWSEPFYIDLCLIIMFVGFLFKVSAAPFHFWSPDVYDGIPTIVTTYVAIISKISLFVFLFELVFYTQYCFSLNGADFSWNTVLLISSLLSFVIGSVLGLTQSRIKRLFAYSTISHVGFILLALSINSAESTQAYIFYIIQYSLSNLNAFMILLTIGYTLYLYVYKKTEDKHDLIDENNSPVQLIKQIKGYFYINPYLSLSLAITLFSFVGVPPLVGFFAKQMVLSAALDSGHVFMALVAILTSVIAAAYYLSVIKEVFFYKPNYIKNPFLDNLNLKAYLYFSRWNNKITNNSYLSKSKENDKQEIDNVLQERDNGQQERDNVDQKINNVDKGMNNALQKTYNLKQETDNLEQQIVTFTPENITISSSLTSIISVLTMLLLLFIYIPGVWFNLVTILTLILFKC